MNFGLIENYMHIISIVIYLYITHTNQSFEKMMGNIIKSIDKIIITSK